MIDGATPQTDFWRYTEYEERTSNEIAAGGNIRMESQEITVITEETWQSYYDNHYSFELL
jgi:hypothetical protein